MLIGIVSDTHGHIPFTENCVDILKSNEVERVIHCGDIGSPEVIPLFSELPAHFVFGNVDYDHAELRETIEDAGLTCHDEFGSVEWAGRKIAFLHSHDHQRFQETVADSNWDLVCYGHTHQAKQQYVGNTLVLNPGAVFRANPRSIAIVDLRNLEVASKTLS